MENTWAIRDIEHGKTFYFKTWEELLAFVIKIESQSQQQIVDEICKKHGAH